MTGAASVRHDMLDEPRDEAVPPQPGGDGALGDGSHEAEYRGRLQESRAWNIPAYLLAGVIGFGGLGWSLDRLIGTDFIVGIGVVAGMALAVYYVWFRYGTP